MGLKVAVIGAGSTYTPELVDGLLTRLDRLPVDELALMDPDTERLGIIAGFAERMAKRAGSPVRLTATDRREAAIDGADFVLVQLRVGGQAIRRVDETLPHRFGILGQETTGPGGFGKALRTVPVVLDVADDVARRSNKDAWIIDFTNPVGIVTQALLDHGARAIGLCNVAIGLQRRIAAHFEVAPERVELEHVGLNHLTWERAVRIDGVDRLPDLLDHELEGLAELVDIPAGAIELLRAIPSYYLRYFYCRDEVLEGQRHGKSRAEEVMEVELELLRMYQDPSVTEKPKLLERRGGAFYSEAAAMLMASLHAGTGDVQVVNVRNQGAIPDLPDDAVVETNARIDRDGAHPIRVAPLAPEMRGLVQSVKAYEDLAVQAAITGDRRIAERAMLAHPLVGQHDKAVGLVDAIIEANGPMLAQFYPSADGLPMGARGAAR
jgi:6-phospho-beta-glucosidase